MQNQIIIIALLVMYSSGVLAQFGPQQIINDTGLVPRYVQAADIDNDGDMDVVSAISGSDQIAWYENVDGQANFGPLQVIINTVQDVRFVGTADIDGDNDLDIITTCPGDDMVLWVRNEDGLGDFGGPQIVAADAVGANVCAAADLDGDGDVDMISANRNEDSVAWYRNTNGMGNFGSEIIISDSVLLARFILAEDVDGDGDIDVIAASSGLSKIFWYDNDGAGNFGVGQMLPGLASGTVSIFAEDLDGDNDIDILVAATTGDRVFWYENTDGLGTYSSENVITTETDSPQSVFAADLDEDGDIDVLSATFNGIIAWYENVDGQGTFGPQQIITTNAENARSVHAADLDGDGDNDVLSASIIGHKIAWYENLTILGVPENTSNTVVVYPNPTDDVIDIVTEATIKSLRMYNSAGLEVMVTLKDTHVIDMAKLSSGVYTLVVESENGARLSEKIIKE